MSGACFTNSVIFDVTMAFCGHTRIANVDRRILIDTPAPAGTGWPAAQREAA